MRKFPALLICLVFAITALAMPAYAAEPGSITLHYYVAEEEQPLADALFYIYLVATPNGRGGYILTDEFKDYPIDLDSLDPDFAGIMTDSAGTLAAYAALNCTPIKNGKTDQTGSLIFGGLSDGIYLLRGEPLTITLDDREVTYISQSILTFLPFCELDGTVSRDSVLDVKYEFHYSDDGEEKTEITVKKVWDDDGSHPDSVTVALIYTAEDSGEFSTEIYDTMELNGDNEWQYTWSDLEASYVWQIVEEDIPEGYTVSVNQEGTSFTVTNKSNPSDDPPDVPPDYPPNIPPSDDPPDVPPSNPPVNPPSNPPVHPNIPPARPNIPPVGPSDDLPDDPSDETLIDEPLDPGGNSLDGNGDEIENNADNIVNDTEDNIPNNTDENIPNNTDDDPPIETDYAFPKDPFAKDANDLPEDAIVPEAVPTEGTSLPQTGQLWWPVPLMLGAGIPLSGIGIVIRRKEQENE